MFRAKTIRRPRWRAVGGACLVGVAAVLASALAHAHFILMTPDSWMSQTSAGFPQKLGPCGDEGGGTPTGHVTAFHPGETIAVTIDEVIMHPGHYRVALAVNDRSELPEEPKVRPKTGDPCAHAEIEDPPVFPVLADNVLPHTQAFGAPPTFTVTLPTDVTCTKCTLQVLEFMSSHPAPCFYHHCADISIQGESTTSTTLPGGSAGSTTTTTVPCSTPRCFVDALLHGPACASDTIPAAIRRRLDRVPVLQERADASRPGKARALRTKARRFLKRAAATALRASRARNPKLSAGCAASIQAATEQLANAF